MGTWQAESEQALTLLSRMSNTGGDGSTSSFCRLLVEAKCDNLLEETLGFDENQLAGLF